MELKDVMNEEVTFGILLFSNCNLSPTELPLPVIDKLQNCRIDTMVFYCGLFRVAGMLPDQRKLIQLCGFVLITQRLENFKISAGLIFFILDNVSNNLIPSVRCLFSQ